MAEAEASVEQLVLLDDQQGLTSLSAVTSGAGVIVRGKKATRAALQSGTPGRARFVSEVREEADDDEDEIEVAEVDSSDDELQQRFEKMTDLLGFREETGNLVCVQTAPGACDRSLSVTGKSRGVNTHSVGTSERFSPALFAAGGRQCFSNSAEPFL